MARQPDNEILRGILQHSVYDPVKAHQYYEEHKHLKGRHPGHKDANVVNFPAKKTTTTTSHHGVPPELEAQVKRLTARLEELRQHLQTLLESKRKKSSSPPTKKHETQAEKQKKAAANKKYQQEHKAQLAQKRKQAASGGGGGGTPISSMTESELRAAISRTQQALHAAVAKARAAANRGTA